MNIRNIFSLLFGVIITICIFFSCGKKNGEDIKIPQFKEENINASPIELYVELDKPIKKASFSLEKYKLGGEQKASLILEESKKEIYNNHKIRVSFEKADSLSSWKGEIFCDISIKEGSQKRASFRINISGADLLGKKIGLPLIKSIEALTGIKTLDVKPELFGYPNMAFAKIVLEN